MLESPKIGFNVDNTLHLVKCAVYLRQYIVEVAYVNLSRRFFYGSEVLKLHIGP